MTWLTRSWTHEHTPLRHPGSPAHQPLQERQPLPARNRDHALTGRYRSIRECDIEPDWLFLYRISNDHLALIAIGTGTHDSHGLE